MKTYLEAKAETKGMNRYQIEIYLHRNFGSSIGWLANVINVHSRKPMAKIQMLLALAADNRVAPASFTMDYVLVDGTAVQLGTLENAVEWVRDEQGNKVLQPAEEIMF